MTFRAGSAEELAASSNVVRLPDDEYLAEVVAMEFLPKENQQPTQYGPPQDQYIAHLKMISFADGSDLEDDKGSPLAEEVVLKTFINHNKMGMIPQPSKARKFFAALLRQPIANSIEIADFPDGLIGKQLYVSTMNKPNSKGDVWTRAQDFRPIKIERARRGEADETANATAPEEAPVVTF